MREINGFRKYMKYNLITDQNLRDAIPHFKKKIFQEGQYIYDDMKGLKDSKKGLNNLVMLGIDDTSGSMALGTSYNGDRLCSFSHKHHDKSQIFMSLAIDTPDG